MTLWFNRVKELAEEFHDLIQPAGGITRFLGNSSFRCQRGFPSMRLGNDDVFVSRRNVDKRFIDADHMVKVKLDPSSDVHYWGDHKPSVDTPIQLRLYKFLPDINFMVHSHVYVKDAPFTGSAIPCGGVEEVAEVMRTIRKTITPHEYIEGSINLLGHGSIVMSRRADYVDNVKFYRRPAPEIME